MSQNYGLNHNNETTKYNAQLMETEILYRFSIDLAQSNKRINLYAVKVKETAIDELIYYWFDGETCKYTATIKSFTNLLNREGWVHTN